MAEQAIRTLAEVPGLGLPKKAARDIAIMRFVYTTEAVWRALQRYLLVVEGVDASTPKACMRRAREAGLLSDEQTRHALAMVDDRNLTVHTYNEALAEAIAARVPGHQRLMQSLLDAVAARTAGA